MAKTVFAKESKLLFKNLKNQGKKIVLVGGCFDVLHPGHIVFLEKAKKTGDILIVLLESDKSVKKLKGSDRPFHSQKMRAQVLSALAAVDYVILLPFLTSNQSYDRIIGFIKPDIIAVTKGYAKIDYHRQAAKMTGAKLKYVTNIIGKHSTSRILEHRDEN